jgi:ATP-dependent DNA helicase RecG
MNRLNNKNPERVLNRRPAISIDTPVQYLKGIGPQRARLLQRLGIKTLHDLFYYIPWRYEDRRVIKRLSELRYGQLETTTGEVISKGVVTTPKKRLKIFEIAVTDGSAVLYCKWFNQPYLEKHFRKGQRIILSGVVKPRSFAAPGFEMENPVFEPVDTESRFIHTSRIVPVYKATEGISTKQLRTLMYNIITTHKDLIEDYVPGDILKRNGLMPLRESLMEVHFPEGEADIEALNRGLSPAHRRLAFDELFLLELGLAIMKRNESVELGISFKDGDGLVRRFIEALPFELTSAQKRVIGQIMEDMESPLPMNRLVHGDVGCGKTVVALAAMLKAVGSGYQSCLMAPTEILAEQHYINIHRMVEGLGLNVVMLTSGTKDKPLEEIQRGDAHIVIGTHALIQERVRFNRLGLTIIDEQHKFGVIQRASLRRKGVNPDVLVMTATPIPRTLALTLYGDLDISVIDELPPGRRPVLTKVFFPSMKEKIYSLIEDELSKGRQAYVVYPLIEGSERLDLKTAIEGAEALRRVFPERRVGLVHGRMNASEREAVMLRFKSGEIDILVATTVIEVGVDVPNASLMLIVHAERFGLAQLHQLRGRIGRGTHESYCILLAYPPFTEEAHRRLKAMESTSDGFKIAEEDLLIRGPGEFFGTRQSGMPDLRVANIIRDVDLLEISRREAFALADADPGLRDYPLLREFLNRRWMGRLELIKS